MAGMENIENIDFTTSVAGETVSGEKAVVVGEKGVAEKGKGRKRTYKKGAVSFLHL